MDELFIRIRGKQHYLWRAVDQDGTGGAYRAIPARRNGRRAA
jgi:transposase-like protein